MTSSWAELILQNKCVEFWDACITFSKRTQFKYVWRLENVSDIPGLVTSLTFPTSSKEGIQWRLQLNPRLANTGILRVNLNLLSCPEPALDFDYEIKLVNSKTPSCPVVYSAMVNLKRLQSTCADLKMSAKFFDGDNCLFHDDNLTLKCQINVKSLVTSANQTIPRTELPNPYLQLSEDLGNIFHSGEQADVVFEVNGKEISAHKTILSARSPVFRAMFEHEMMERKSSRVQLQDMDADVLNELLRFIYTGNIPNLTKIAAKLMAAADKYDLETLKIKCEQAVYATLSFKTAIEALNIADICNAKDLKAKTLRYIHFHLKDVAKTDEWKQATKTCPNLALEVLQVGIDQETANKQLEKQ